MLSLDIRIGPSGSRFSPAPLFAAGEPGAWFDPSDLTTLFQDDAATVPVTAAGQSVAVMLDKSGRGNHATQTTALNRPTYQVDSSGRGHLLFDGSNDGMVTASIVPGIDKAQVFAGVRKLSDAAAGCIVESSTNWQANAGALALLGPTAAAANYGSRSGGSLPGGTPTSASTFVSPITNVITATSDIAGDSAALRINGLAIGSSVGDQGTGNYLTYPLYIGRRAGASIPFNGRIYSLIVRFGANLSAEQISAMESWVNAKTGAY